MKPSKKTALVYAVDLLARQAYSVKLLTDKLQRKGYQPDDIEEAVQKLRQRGYLDDEALCQSMYRKYISESKYSLRYIEYQLQQKGFNQVMIGASRRDGDKAAEKVAAVRLIRARYHPDAKDETAKIAQFLYRKGFDGTTIREAVSSIMGENCTLIEE